MFRLTFLLLGFSLPLWAAQFSDRMLADLAEKVPQAIAANDPVDMVLLAEKIYFMGHETSQQAQITQLLHDLFDAAPHQELKAELGHFLAQQYRNQGQYDRVADLIRGLGYVREWQFLGPLSPKEEVDLPAMLALPGLAGLDREITWRSLQAYGEKDYWSEGMGHYGYLGANHAVFPNQLAGTLFTTWFHAPAKGTYRFGLGWANKVTVWVNQTKLFSGDESQGTHPDQQVLTMKLGKGWHRLSVHLISASEKPNLGFYGRLTDEAGKPLVCKATRDSKRTPSKKVKPGVSESSLAELAKQKSPYALASVLILKEQLNHDRFGNARELMGQAFNQNPSRAVVEKLIAMTDDVNQDWQYLSSLLAHLPAEPESALNRAWALAELGQIALGQKRFWEARQYAESALKAEPEYWPAEILITNVFSQMGLNGEALRRTEALAKKYPDIPWVMMDLCDLYFAMNFLNETESMLDRIHDIRHGNRKFAERKIDILKGKGDIQGLDHAYRNLIQDGPYAVTLVLAYAQFLKSNAMYGKAETLLKSYLDQLPENPYLLEAMGDVKLATNVDEALVYLEQALALQPQNPGLENLINLTKAEEVAFYQPFKIEEAPDVAAREVSPVIINFENTVTKVSQGGQSSVYHQVEFLVEQDDKLQDFPGHSFSYAPLRQKARVLKAEIYRGEQTILLTNYGRSRISDPQYRMYYDLVAYQIPFPKLQKGDRIRIEYRIDDISSTNIYGDYFGDLTYFSQAFPAKYIGYTLILPKERKIHYHVEKMEPTFTETVVDDNRVYSWELEQVSPYEMESRMPGISGYLPYLSVSTFDDWQEMASWYANLIKDQLNLDHETKQLVAEIVAESNGRMDILKRIHEYVVTNTRYVALEFGIHGYKPYEVNQVCSRQFGDCKDKASLMIAMLREAGIEASIAIVRTSDEGDIHTFPAMLSYFNHAIAYIPEFDIFLDGTAEFSGIKELPQMDQGALTLIVDHEGRGNLRKIPVYETNDRNYEIDLKLGEQGLAEVAGELSYRGVDAPSMRQFLSIDAKLSQNLQSLLANRVPGLDVLEADRTGTRINEDVRLIFKGVSSKLIQSVDNGLRLPLNILNSRLTQTYAPNAKRRFPLEFGSPKTQSVSINIAVPKGYVLAEKPEPLDLEDENFKVSIRFAQESPEQVRIDYEVAFKAFRVNPDEYTSLRNMFQSHDRVLEQALYFVEP